MTDFSKVEAILPDVLNALDDLKSDQYVTSGHEAKYGKKYIKITHNGSAYAFLDADGNIYMPASWRAPAKHIRGSIFDENYSIGKAFGPYGVAYLR